MPVKIGIDIGSSTTKIVAFEGEHMLPPMAVKADSQVASLYGAFGRYLYENNLELADVEGVYITGVGSKYVEKAVYDRPTYKVDEFVATGTGGYYLTDKKEVIVISMGTGSFFVKVTEKEMKHLGGVGLGGGTICGLSSIMLNTGDIHEIVPLSRKGDVAKIDLRIADLAKEKLPSSTRNSPSFLPCRAGLSNACCSCSFERTPLFTSNSPKRTFFLPNSMIIHLLLLHIWVICIIVAFFVTTYNFFNSILK